MRTRMWLMIASVAVFAAVQSASAWAQMCTVDKPCIYSVKFLCGVQPVSANLHPPSEPPVKPGNYATAVNIHNFHHQPITFNKSAVIAKPEGDPRGQVSPSRPVTLQPGQAIEIDCSDIVSLLKPIPPPPIPPPPPLPTFIKGFVELTVAGPANLPPPILSVTAVYTAQAIPVAGAPPGGGPVSLEIVPVQPFTGP